MEIVKISFEEILPIWRDHLWPSRVSDITSNSAMCYMGGYDMLNMETVATFFAIVCDREIAGVNSGHMCNQLSYRSRGLFVFDKYRKMGLGKRLLEATIDQGRKENATMCWSYPRLTSWKTYQSAGFSLSSEWEKSETSEANAYCYIDLS